MSPSSLESCASVMGCSHSNCRISARVKSARSRILSGSSIMQTAFLKGLDMLRVLPLSLS